MKTAALVMFVLVASGLPRAAGAAQASDATVAPVLVKEVKPAYTRRALHEKQHGLVGLELTVLPDGTVGKVRVTKHLSRDLDAEAVKAAKQWRFKPGTKKGKAVPVETHAEMTFTLR